MLEPFIALLAPHCCLICGSEGALVCDFCLPDAFDHVPERCYVCMTLTQDATVCTKCRKGLKHVWVRTQYDGIAKQLVHHLKFERAKAAASLIASELDEVLPYLPPGTVVTYVPTATKRIRIRGYDQARLIAQQLAKRRGLSCQPLLKRIGQERQVGSGRAARIAQALHEYGALRIATVPSSVLLIDDIVTTGSTIESCAKVLRAAGVQEINAAVFAQKQ